MDEFPKPHITNKEAAELLGVTTKTLRNYRWNNAYHLMYLKHGNRIYYSLPQLKEFMKDRSKFSRIVRREDAKT